MWRKSANSEKHKPEEIFSGDKHQSEDKMKKKKTFCL